MLSKTQRHKFTLFTCLLAGIFILSACGNLREQPKYNKPYDASPIFGSAARQLDPNAVPIGYLREDDHLYRGLVNGEPAETYPFEITSAILDEGRRLYEGYCSACHGYSGYGNGVTTLEGYPQPGPRSFHEDALRDAPNGRYFNAITNGVGTMFSYGARITPEERWAIIAYVRAMQYSQNPPSGS